MALKDYTTKKTPEDTISEIQKLLKDFGVRGVMSKYDDQGEVVSMAFEIIVDKRPMGFRLPTKWEPVLKALQQDRRVPRHYCNENQARKTAWRQVYHWVDAQLALVKVNMVKMQTVFLPYIVTGDGRTLHEKFETEPNTLLLTQ